ncbi:MAG TPA: prepilin peptidase [Nitrospinota bacterium]|nr:prepilin peptidase [Nitrospinota bacterium]
MRSALSNRKKHNEDSEIESIQLAEMACLFLLGLCVGSFLNVVIYRMPKGLSVMRPCSHCPQCGEPIIVKDNIPLVSWCALGGICRYCGTTISLRYPFVELITGILTLLVFAQHGYNATSMAYGVFLWILVAAVFIDLEYQIIPDELSFGALVFGVLISHFTLLGIAESLYGILLGGGLFFILAICYPNGLGGGDIKLMAAIGAFLGWKLALLVIVLASITGALFGVSSILFFGGSRTDKVPFGPFLSIGALAAVFYGERFIGSYLIP